MVASSSDIDITVHKINLVTCIMHGTFCFLSVMEFVRSQMWLWTIVVQSIKIPSKSSTFFFMLLSLEKKKKMHSLEWPEGIYRQTFHFWVKYSFKLSYQKVSQILRNKFSPSASKLLTEHECFFFFLENLELTAYLDYECMILYYA